MEKQEYVEFQTKEKGKSPETDLKEMEISYLSDREFKITIKKCLPRSDKQGMNKVRIPQESNA